MIANLHPKMGGGINDDHFDSFLSHKIIPLPLALFVLNLPIRMMTFSHGYDIELVILLAILEGSFCAAYHTLWHQLNISNLIKS